VKSGSFIDSKEELLGFIKIAGKEAGFTKFVIKSSIFVRFPWLRKFFKMDESEVALSVPMDELDSGEGIIHGHILEIPQGFVNEVYKIYQKWPFLAVAMVDAIVCHEEAHQKSEITGLDDKSKAEAEVEASAYLLKKQGLWGAALFIWYFTYYLNTRATVEYCIEWFGFKLDGEQIERINELVKKIDKEYSKKGGERAKRYRRKVSSLPAELHVPDGPMKTGIFYKEGVEGVTLTPETVEVVDEGEKAALMEEFIEKFLVLFNYFHEERSFARDYGKHIYDIEIEEVYELAAKIDLNFDKETTILVDYINDWGRDPMKGEKAFSSLQEFLDRFNPYLIKYGYYFCLDITKPYPKPSFVGRFNKLEEAYVDNLEGERQTFKVVYLEMVNIRDYYWEPTASVYLLPASKEVIVFEDLLRTEAEECVEGIESFRQGASDALLKEFAYKQWEEIAELPEGEIIERITKDLISSGAIEGIRGATDIFFIERPKTEEKDSPYIDEEQNILAQKLAGLALGPIPYYCLGKIVDENEKYKYDQICRDIVEFFVSEIEGINVIITDENMYEKMELLKELNKFTIKEYAEKMYKKRIGGELVTGFLKELKMEDLLDDLTVGDIISGEIGINSVPLDVLEQSFILTGKVGNDDIVGWDTVVNTLKLEDANPEDIVAKKVEELIKTQEEWEKMTKLYPYLEMVKYEEVRKTTYLSLHWNALRRLSIFNKYEELDINRFKKEGDYIETEIKKYEDLIYDIEAEIDKNEEINDDQSDFQKKINIELEKVDTTIESYEKQISSVKLEIEELKEKLMLFGKGNRIKEKQTSIDNLESKIEKLNNERNDLREVRSTTREDVENLTVKIMEQQKEVNKYKKIIEDLELKIEEPETEESSLVMGVVSVPFISLFFGLPIEWGFLIGMVVILGMNLFSKTKVSQEITHIEVDATEIEELLQKNIETPISVEQRKKIKESLIKLLPEMGKEIPQKVDIVFRLAQNWAYWGLKAEDIENILFSLSGKGWLSGLSREQIKTIALESEINPENPEISDTDRILNIISSEHLESKRQLLVDIINYLDRESKDEFTTAQVKAAGFTKIHKSETEERRNVRIDTELRYLLDNGFIERVYDEDGKLKQGSRRLTQAVKAVKKELLAQQVRDFSSVKQRSITAAVDKIEEGMPYKIEFENDRVIVNKIEGGKKYEWGGSGDIVYSKVSESLSYRGHRAILTRSREEYKEFVHNKMEEAVAVLEKEIFLKNVPLDDFQKILMLGIGTSLAEVEVVLEKFSNTKKIVIVDFSKENILSLVSEVLKLPESVQQKITIYQADVRKMPFEENTFDLLIGFRVLVGEILKEDLEEAWHEAERVLRRGGIGIVSTTVFDKFSSQQLKISGIRYVKPRDAKDVFVLPQYSTEGEHTEDVIVWQKNEEPVEEKKSIKESSFMENYKSLDNKYSFIKKKTIVIAEREYIISSDGCSAPFIATFQIGPCVVTLYDKKSKIGCIAHFDKGIDVAKSTEKILKEMASHNVDISSLEVNLFGGDKGFSEEMISEMKTELEKRKINNVKEDLFGENQLRHILLDTRTGKIYYLRDDEDVFTDDDFGRSVEVHKSAIIVYRNDERGIGISEKFDKVISEDKFIPIKFLMQDENYWSEEILNALSPEFKETKEVFIFTHLFSDEILVKQNEKGKYNSYIKEVKDIFEYSNIPIIIFVEQDLNGNLSHIEKIREWNINVPIIVIPTEMGSLLPIESIWNWKKIIPLFNKWIKKAYIGGEKSNVCVSLIDHELTRNQIEAITPKDIGYPRIQSRDESSVYEHLLNKFRENSWNRVLGLFLAVLGTGFLMSLFGIMPVEAAAAPEVSMATTGIMFNFPVIGIMVFGIISMGLVLRWIIRAKAGFLSTKLILGSVAGLILCFSLGQFDWFGAALGISSGILFLGTIKEVKGIKINNFQQAVILQEIINRKTFTIPQIVKKTGCSEGNLRNLLKQQIIGPLVDVIRPEKGKRQPNKYIFKLGAKKIISDELKKSEFRDILEQQKELEKALRKHLKRAKKISLKYKSTVDLEQFIKDLEKHIGYRQYAKLISDKEYGFSHSLDIVELSLLLVKKQKEWTNDIDCTLLVLGAFLHDISV
ncbi:methyltransferase domain-containing protein, partial [bacterium]|nr:methyltransferase domain-containing protein [bacterium]